jgi:hypothetical protein
MNTPLAQEGSKARARERQRRYRLRRPRIHYFPDPHAATTIDSLRTRFVGGDASSVINRILREWSESRGLAPSALSAKRFLDQLIVVAAGSASARARSWHGPASSLRGQTCS